MPATLHANPQQQPGVKQYEVSYPKYTIVVVIVGNGVVDVNCVGGSE